MPTGCPEAHLNPALPSGGRSAVPAPVPAVLLDSASALHGGEGCVWGTLEAPQMPPVAAAAMISAVAVAVSSPPPARAHKRAAPSDEAAAAQDLRQREKDLVKARRTPRRSDGLRPAGAPEAAFSACPQPRAASFRQPAALASASAAASALALDAGAEDDVLAERGRAGGDYPLLRQWRLTLSSRLPLRLHLRLPLSLHSY